MDLGEIAFINEYNEANDKLLDEIQKAGFEQAELTVLEGNSRTYKLYQSLGFVECGRMPRANKYSDGTYADDIHMVLDFYGK